MKKLILSTLIAIGFIGSASAQYGTTLTNGLVAYYPLNGNANDASGNGNDGSCSNGVTFTTGYNGLLSANFNGNSQYIRVPTALSADNLYTWSCWFVNNDPSHTQYGAILSQGADPGVWSYGPAIDLNCPTRATAAPPNSLRAYAWEGSVDEIWSSTNISWAQWHHVVLTSDGNGNGILYINGVISCSGRLYHNQTENNFYIGGAPVSSDPTIFLNPNFALGALEMTGSNAKR